MSASVSWYESSGFNALFPALDPTPRSFADVDPEKAPTKPAGAWTSEPPEASNPNAHGYLGLFLSTWEPPAPANPPPQAPNPGAFLAPLVPVPAPSNLQVAPKESPMATTKEEVIATSPTGKIQFTAGVKAHVEDAERHKYYNNWDYRGEASTKEERDRPGYY